MEQVQFAVAQVLDSCTQVLRQHMSLRGRIGCWLCGWYRLYWRWRTVSGRLGREEVGRRLLTTIASHEGIVPPPLSASNFGRKCSRRRGTRRRGLWAWLAERAGFGMCGWASEMPFRPGNADWLIALSPCPALIGFGTRDKRRYGCLQLLPKGLVIASFGMAAVPG